MDETPEYLENLWDDMLSRKPEQILAAYASLSADMQQSILAHLRRMVEDPGWQPEQRASALAALAAINERPSGEE
jgi:hypothetical protein